jgi:ABC-2 type transport system permease protein
MSQLIRIIKYEFGRIFAEKAAFSILVIAVAIYAVFYPQPYVNEALRNVPIAVVDLDGTQSSRDFARLVDATPDVAVVSHLPDVTTAEREVFARNIDGILVIPQYFERELLHGRQSPVALYADASYFLIYQRVAGAVSAVAQTLGAQVEATRLVEIGIDPVIATAATNPMPLTAVPIFNPEGGYATYILPGALVLILQQTLLIGVGLLGTSPGADPRRTMADPPSMLTILIGKLLAYLALEAVIIPLYLVVGPYLYGLPRLGSVSAILLFAIPFVFAVGSFGLFLASIFRTPLAVQLCSAAVGLPFFMLAGFSWPTQAMPEGIRLAAKLVPSTEAIDGFVRLSQLGAPLSDVRPQLLTLWGLAIGYGALSLLITRMRDGAAKASPRPAAASRPSL